MTSRLRQPVLVAGVVAAALLALRAVAPLVSPPRSAVAEVASPRLAVAAANRPAELAEATGASLLLGGEDGLFRVDVDARAAVPDPPARPPVRGRPGADPAGRDGGRRPRWDRLDDHGRVRAPAGPARPGLLRAGRERPSTRLAGRGDRRPRALVPGAGGRDWPIPGATPGAGPRQPAAQPAAGGWGARRAAPGRRRAGKQPGRLGPADRAPAAAVRHPGAGDGGGRQRRPGRLGRGDHPAPGRSGRRPGSGGAGPGRQRRVRARRGPSRPTGACSPPSPRLASRSGPPSPLSGWTGARRCRWPGRRGLCQTAAPPAWPGRRPATGCSSVGSGRGSASAPTASTIHGRPGCPWTSPARSPEPPDPLTRARCMWARMSTRPPSRPWSRPATDPGRWTGRGRSTRATTSGRRSTASMPTPIRVPGAVGGAGAPRARRRRLVPPLFDLDDADGWWTLRFGAVMDIAEVWLNGGLLGSARAPLHPVRARRRRAARGRRERARGAGHRPAARRPLPRPAPRTASRAGPTTSSRAGPAST